jgi:subtilisin-like proprotein convertase family protein
MIAIVDTGVDTNHYDLRGNLCDRSLWYDAYDNNQRPYDQYYHGTGVSGCSNAIGNNDTGTVGVAYTSKLMPVRVFGPYPAALTTDLILGKGLNWSWKNGASVINCSWGGGIPTPIITYAIQNAVRYGRNNRGTIVCAGSGNDDTNAVLYPSSMDEVMSCGGLSPCNERKNKHSCDFNGIDSSVYWGASYGEGLDFVVPCVYIGTTELLGYWCLCGNGTSESSPLACGVVALVLSKNINLSYDSVRIVIEKSCVKVGNYNYNFPKQYGMWNNEMGYGRIDARAALDMTPPGPGTIGDKVSPIIKIYPPQSQVFNGIINFYAEIYDNISVAGGTNSPRLYYRTLQHPNAIQSTIGSFAGHNLYHFDFPLIPVSEGFYYYISAQDEAIDPNVITYPIGGKGNNPPGNIAPRKFMFVRNSSLFDTSFVSTDVPKPIISQGETTFVSVMNNVPARIICDVNCTINVTHTFDADLTFILISPSGTPIVLAGGVGWDGDGFDTTSFDDEAPIAIDSSAALAPFRGTFKPIEKLWLFDGENAGGQWKLQVTDNGYGDGGTLRGWNLSFKFATDDNVTLPGKFALVKNYPNPFNPKTRIVFNVPYSSNIKITIYDLTGREVATLVNETRPARLEDYVDFDTSDPAFNNGKGLASGVYF